jgi:hypothetical protein
LVIENIRRATIEPEYRLDASIALAMSSILIEGSSGRASEIACDSARYFENRARIHTSELLEHGDIATKNKNVQVARLKIDRIQAVIADRIAAACERASLLNGGGEAGGSK